MRKYIYIKTLIVLFFSCTPKIDVSTNNKFNTVNQSGFIEASIVAGFDHVYDSCSLIVTNRANGLQYFYNNSDPVFNSISLTVGNYGFFMSAPDADTIQSYVSFVAYDTDVPILKGQNTVLLSSESKQSLILLDRSSVEGVPLIQVGSKVGLMSISGTYYYAYVLDNALLSYSVGGNEVKLPVNVIKQNIYLISASAGSININDPFLKVIII